MSKQGETVFMVFSLGFTALVLLFVLKLICSECIACCDCCLCWELLGFRTPAPAPVPAPALITASAAAGPRPAPASAVRPCLCANPAQVVRGSGDPRAGVRRSTGPVPCVTEYRRSDGWREATCPVCLSEFVDGEAVRVLPACMHYFHAACVGEWLRKGHATCPLCRAAPPSAVAAAAGGSPEYVISIDQLLLS
ncbi:E3 ubiquitin-protein ligase Os03g0188200 [Brachypodium distachyon]|uniref:E3 ubiquitin-protein ligase Os03g0188200 n=1 Tax=Brachypodium distachyon TaxID=15368 RepID=UPI00052FE5C3|nr:E3 ubiquitin-protein ligase Os03g0188200 [Brachypodium distachyon]|eukprot:XP_010238977.1 E3 ubiquitin-protein ligase Os03g0188200 [Brachypodium distachyon]